MAALQPALHWDFIHPVYESPAICSTPITYLNGNREGVANMQSPCDVGRRDDHDKHLSALSLNRLEQAELLPPGIPV